MQRSQTVRDLIRLPTDPAVCSAPSDVRDLATWCRERTAKVRPTKRRLNIMSALATGWLPWGVAWHPSLVHFQREFILCCGHTMGIREAQLLVTNGLMTIGLDQHGNEGLVITPAGLAWLQANW